MATETERKFLLAADTWKNNEDGTPRTGTAYKQGYLMSTPEKTVRIRIAGDKGFITIKGPSLDGTLTRQEFEYTIPLDDAENIFENLCEPQKIEKTRYVIPYAEHVWEVDVFHGNNEGLILAEVELDHEDEFITMPPWIGEEVTHDARYFNSLLAKNPFSQWN